MIILIIVMIAILIIFFFFSAAFFHGQTMKIDAHRKDVATLLPATFVTATMTSSNPGTWLLNCVVTDHYAAGT